MWGWRRLSVCGAPAARLGCPRMDLTAAFRVRGARGPPGLPPHGPHGGFPCAGRPPPACAAPAWTSRRLSVCGAPAGGGGLGPGQIPDGIRGRVWPQARPDSQWESAGTGVSKAQWAGVRPHWGRLKCIGVGCGALGQLNNLPQWGLTCPSRWFPAPMRRWAPLGARWACGPKSV